MASTSSAHSWWGILRAGAAAGVLLACLFAGMPSAAHAITLDELRAEREAAKHRERRLIFNNDGGDVIYGAEHTPQGLLDVRTSGLAGTQVDSIYYTSRSSGFGLFTHNTQVGEIFTSTGGRYSNNMTQDLIDQGTDVLKVMSQFARANDIEMIWSMRMNDTHDASGDSYTYAFPRLKVDHPEWLMGSLTDRPAHGAWSAIDYGVAEVRSLALAYVEEVCENYDIDGVELDFFRHPFYFRSHTSGGKATQADRDQMTQLIRDIRTMTERVGLERERPFLLSIRIPDSMGYCRDIGLDVTQWLQEGLVDTMAVSCYVRAEPWSASVALGHQYDVPVYASLSESRMSGEAGAIRKSFDSYMARASGAWQEGVDGIYMFNYTDDDSPLWNIAGDSATLAGVNKVYTTGARGVGYLSSSLAGGMAYLNRTVVSPERTMTIAPGAFRDIPLTIGDDLSGRSPADARARLRLQVANLSSADGLSVWLNNTLLPTGSLANGYLDYMLDLSLVEQGNNVFRIAGDPFLGGNVTLKDFLVYLSFRPIGFRAPTLEEAFLTGSPADPARGQYAVGPLVGAAPNVSPFAGPWVQGQGSHPEYFQVVASGLDRADLDTRAGAVRYQSPTALAGAQTALRTFASDATTSDRVFYMAGLMSIDENFSTDAGATAMTGLLNAEEGDPNVPWTIGMQWGFQSDGAGGVDAVVRYRDNATNYPVVTTVVGDNVEPGTHLFVVRVDVDVSSSTDNVAVWLDPADTWSEAAPSLAFDAACWLLPSDNPDRLVDTLVLRVANAGAGAAVLFDEIRLGKTWNDLFLPLPGDVPGDANGDCVVDRLDAAILAAHWLATGGVAWTDGDFNADGRVDDLDLAILAANWTAAPSGANVPEPSVPGLLAGAAIALAGRWFAHGRGR
ncbi:MAG: hypothetical protein JW809_19830 [Pirellulales bacterium]|nr:hypothetical protein [Pirellulales bacterium]